MRHSFIVSVLELLLQKEQIVHIYSPFLVIIKVLITCCALQTTPRVPSFKVFIGCDADC
jgi:hypothetical protein